MLANFYVDGYNLYCGLCDAKLHGSVWLNLQKLCESLLPKHETLGRIKYFTCLPYHDSRKLRDHEIYLSALAAECPKVEQYLGDFAEIDNSLVFCQQCKTYFNHAVVECPSCGWRKGRWSHIEKQTDVGLAINLVRDALTNDFQVAYLITGDTDFIPALDMVRKHNSKLKLGVYFPPLRKHEGFRNYVKFALEIRPHEIKACQFPINIQTPDRIITKPATWNQ